MANEKPEPPNLSCPVTTDVDNSYYTDQQSHLNVARKDQFRLVIDIPNILKPYIKKENRYCHGGNLDKLQITIWGFQVPSIKVDTMQIKYGGQTLKFSSLARPAYPPQNIKFTVDNKYDNYWILWKWLDIQNDDMNSIFDGKGLKKSSTGHLGDYSTTFTVYALDEYDVNVAAWDFYGSFPIELGSIDIGSRNPQELESEFTFEFSQLKMRLV